MNIDILRTLSGISKEEPTLKTTEDRFEEERLKREKEKKEAPIRIPDPIIKTGKPPEGPRASRADSAPHMRGPGAKENMNFLEFMAAAGRQKEKFKRIGSDVWGFVTDPSSEDLAPLRANIKNIVTTFANNVADSTVYVEALLNSTSMPLNNIPRKKADEHTQEVFALLDKLLETGSARTLIRPEFTDVEKIYIKNWAESDPYSGGPADFLEGAFKQSMQQLHILGYSATGNVPAMFDIFYEEKRQIMEKAFEDRGLPFNEKEYRDILTVGAVTSSTLEFMGNAVTLNAAIGRTIKNSRGLAVLSAGVFGGVEEGSQQVDSNFTANRALARYAVANGVEVEAIPLSTDVSKAVGLGSSVELFLGGAGASVATAVDAAKGPEQHVLPEYVMDTEKVLEAIEEYDTTVSLFDEVIQFAQTTKQYTEEAVEQADIELRDILEKETTGNLFKMVRAMGMVSPVQDRQSLINIILSNKFKLPAYKEMAEVELREKIDKSNVGARQKHYMKWMATGEITPNQLGHIDNLLQAMWPNLSYEGTIDEFFEEQMELNGNAYLDFDQITSWFVYGHNAWDIERAFHYIQVRGKEPVSVSVEQLQSGVMLPMVQTKQEGIDQADYKTYPVIIGTTKNGGHILLDGYHRVKKAIQDGTERIAAHVLDFEETKQFAEPGSNLMFNQVENKLEDRVFPSRIHRLGTHESAVGKYLFKFFEEGTSPFVKRETLENEVKRQLKVGGIKQEELLDMNFWGWLNWATMEDGRVSKSSFIEFMYGYEYGTIINQGAPIETTRRVLQESLATRQAMVKKHGFNENMPWDDMVKQLTDRVSKIEDSNSEKYQDLYDDIFRIESTMEALENLHLNNDTEYQEYANMDDYQTYREYLFTGPEARLFTKPLPEDKKYSYEHFLDWADSDLVDYLERVLFIPDVEEMTRPEMVQAMIDMRVEFPIKPIRSTRPFQGQHFSVGDDAIGWFRGGILQKAPHNLGVVFLAEELQADAHQEARKRGYIEEGPKTVGVEITEEMETYYRDRVRKLNSIYEKAYEAAATEEEKNEAFLDHLEEVTALEGDIDSALHAKGFPKDLNIKIGLTQYELLQRNQFADGATTIFAGKTLKSLMEQYETDYTYPISRQQPPRLPMSNTKTWVKYLAGKLLKYAELEGADTIVIPTAEFQYLRWGSEVIQAKRNNKGVIEIFVANHYAPTIPMIDPSTRKGQEEIVRSARDAYRFDHSFKIPAPENVLGGQRLEVKEKLKDALQNSWGYTMTPAIFDAKIESLADKVMEGINREGYFFSLPRYEGMKGFYDRTLPQELNTLLKRYEKGLKVESTEVPLQLANASILINEIEALLKYVEDEHTLNDEVRDLEGNLYIIERRYGGDALTFSIVPASRVREVKNWASHTKKEDFFVSKSDFVHRLDTILEELKSRKIPTRVHSIHLSPKVKTKIRETSISLYQKGRETPSGYVVRGRTSILANAKSMVDLFKTGDFVTLAHEFAHLFSPWMSEEIRDAVISDLMRVLHKDLKGAERSNQEKRYQYIWDTWQEGPMQAYVMFSEEEAEDLTTLQEHLAGSFERYLLTSTAPNHTLEGIFREARETFKEYYRKLRTTAPRVKAIDTKLAKAFDKLLGGDNVLPQDATFIVELADENGKMIKYTLNKSRPQIKMHKDILDYMSKGAGKARGFHRMLEEYTKSMLRTTEQKKLRKEGRLTTAQKNEIALVKSTRKAAIAYLKKVDKQAAILQQREIDDLAAKIRSKVADMKKLKMPDDIQELFDVLIEYVDTKKRSTRNEEQNLNLARKLALFRNAVNNELSEIPEEVRSVTARQLTDLTNFQKRQMHYMSYEELSALYESLEDLRKYNRHRMRQAMEEVAKENEELNRKLWLENQGNWRYRKGSAVALTFKQDRMIKLATKAFGEELKSQLLVMYMFGEGNPDSIWTKMADDLVNGRIRQLEYQKEMYTILRNIYGMLPTHGVSRLLGKVKDSDLVPVQLYREGHGYEDVPLTTAQLMYIYGLTKSEDGLDALFNEMKFREHREESFRFDSYESLLTALDQLPEEYKKIVDYIATLYNNRIYNDVNEVYKGMNYGISLPKVDGYIPKRSIQDDHWNTEFLSLDNLNPREGDWSRAHVLSSSFLQTRKTGPGIYVDDFFEVIGDNINRVSFYMGMAKPITQMRVQVFGAKRGHIQVGKEKAPSVYSQLVKMVGTTGAIQMEQFLNRIEDPTPNRDSLAVRLLIRANSNVRAAYLNLSASVLLIQPITARLMFSYGVPLKYIEAAQVKETASIVGSNSIGDLMEYSPILWERYERIPAVHMETEGINHKARRAWIRPSSYLVKLIHAKSLQDIMDLIKRSDDSTLMALAYFDSRALSMILEATKMWGKAEKWTEDQIRSKFLEIVTQSQPMNDPLFTSNFLSNKNALYKAVFGVYQSARDGIRRTIQRDKMIVANRVAGQTGDTGIGRHVVGLANSIIMANFLAALVQTFFRRIGMDEDDKETMPFWRDWLVQGINNIIGLRPILGGFISGMINQLERGWPITVGEMPLMGASIDTATSIVRTIDALTPEQIEGAYPYTADKEAKWIEPALQTLLNASTFAGSSLYNIERQAEKWYKAIKEEDFEPYY